MIVERDVLENKLDGVISAVYGYKEVVDKFCQNMYHKHGVDIGLALDIIGRTKDVRELSKEMLLWATKELADAVTVDKNTSYLTHRLKLEDFFTSIEIEQFANTKLSDDSRAKFPIVIHNVLEVNQDQFVTVKDVDFIKDLRDRQIVRYNTKTQRETTRRKFRDGYYFTITIIKKAVEQIMEAMSKERFISNAITFNMNADEPVDFEYDRDNQILTIKEATLDIIDGNHRYISMTNVKDNNPEFQYNTIVNIMHFSEDKAKRYIVQENKRNPIAKSKIKSLDVDNVGTGIVTNINERSNSNFKGLIGTTRGSMIKFGLLVDLINYNFELPTAIDVVKAKRYTVDAFNALAEDDLELLSVKQPDLKWALYIGIMSEYFETEDIDSFIQRIQPFKDIDYDEFNIRVHTINKPLYKKIDKIIKQVDAERM